MVVDFTCACGAAFCIDAADDYLVWASLNRFFLAHEACGFVTRPVNPDGSLDLLPLGLEDRAPETPSVEAETIDG